MPQLDSLKDNTTLPIDCKALGLKTKVLAGSTMMVLLCSFQKCSKDTKDLWAMKSGRNHHMCCRKKCLLKLLPTEMEEVAVLGSRLWLMPPLQLNPSVLKIMVPKSAMKPAQVSCKQLAGGYVPSVNFLYL